MRSLVCVCVLSRGPAVFFPRVSMRIRKWAERRKEKHLGRRARCLWQRGMRGMSSTCT